MEAQRDRDENKAGGGSGGGGGFISALTGGNGNKRPDAPKRRPTLEILKQQSVDQEVVYLTPEVTNGSAEGSGRQASPEGVDTLK